MTADQAGLPGPVVSDLPDLGQVTLGELAAMSRAGGDTLKNVLSRVAPFDGRRILLVAAAFNSAI